jgi:hypothetical protein
MMKLKASFAGIASMTTKVKKVRRVTGPRGVPNGLIEEKKDGYGSNPCLATSRSMRA